MTGDKMTANERYKVYISNDFDEKVTVAVIDWAHYWAEAGVESIEDETLRAQTAAAIRQVLDQPGVVVGRVKTLVLGADAVKAAAELTDEVVKAAVDGAFSKSISYII